MQAWTNATLQQKGKEKVSLTKFKAYLGLEAAMSLVRMNTIRQYWSNKQFFGNADFKAVMSGVDFESIRSAIQFHPPVDASSQSNDHDPLWHCRVMLKEFLRNAADIAVPVGCSSLDENGAACSARCAAVSYLPSKPDPYAIRFYATTSSGKSVYCHSMWHNGRGNTTEIPPPSNFVQCFRK